MAKTANQNHGDASNMDMTETCNNGGVAPWSDLNHDALFLVMMQLGVVDFVAFSRVCKSWRSFALSNRNMFIVSRPPMSICISTDAKEKQCHLEDFEGRKYKTTLPLSANTCIGVTCGYLILFGEKTRDFWLVNPVTRHELHFPFPLSCSDFRFFPPFLGAILVFSPLLSGWVMVVFSRYFYSDKIWVSIAGEPEWTNVSTPYGIRDVHAFKGKIYTIDSVKRLCELRLYPTPTMTASLEIKNLLKPDFVHPMFVSLGENLYVMDRFSDHPYKIQEINFSKLEWVSREKTGEECNFFLSSFNHGVAVIQPEPWANIHSLYRRHALTDTNGKGKFFYAKVWYSFQDCLNVNLLHE